MKQMDAIKDNLPKNIMLKALAVMNKTDDLGSVREHRLTHHLSFNPLILRVSLEGNVCHSHSFENNFEIKHKFTKYLKESYCLASDEHFSFKYVHENAFISKIFPKSSGLFWPL